MSLEALVVLRKKVDTLIGKRVAKERKHLEGKITELGGYMGDGGIVFARMKPDGRKGKRAKAPIKYRGPKGEKWSGRGMTPLWMRPLLKKGKKKESFLVKR
jgi:DNA-binding protein H-NS